MLLGRSIPAVVLVGATLLSGCSAGGDESADPRLVVLYATCTMNLDYLGAYDATVSFTPNLDAFAEESVVFRRHQSESGQSGISFASIFSGTQAHAHGVYTHPTMLSDDLYVITEAFADAGYEPFFWSGHSMASYDLNYAQGVPPENVFDPKPPATRAEKLSFLQPADPQFQTVLRRLEQDPSYKAFLLVNFTVTHGLYHRQQPEAFFSEFLSAYPEAAHGKSIEDLRRAWNVYEGNRFPLQWDFPGAMETLGMTEAALRDLTEALEVTYRADVARLDSMFGSTIDELRRVGVLDQSLIAFTADHGETFCRDETLFKWTHGLQLAPEVLSVPWMIRAPLHEPLGFEPGEYEEVTRSIDVYPTLAGLCGIELADRGIQGVDLSGVLLGESERKPLLAYSHTTTIGPLSIDDFRSWGEASKYWYSESPDLIWVCVRDEDVVYKWRNRGGANFGAEVFDLARDPDEAVNLFDPGDAHHVEMIDRLKTYKALLVARFDDRGTEMGEDALENLEALGYVE